MCVALSLLAEEPGSRGVSGEEEGDRVAQRRGHYLPGPGRNQRPQRSVGCEDAVVTVTVNTRWREDLSQAVQELESREVQGGAAGQVGFQQHVEDLVGTVGDQVEAVEGEGWPGTIPDQALEADSVMALDTDAGVEAEPTTVIPAEHILGCVGFQEAVAGHMAENPLSHRVLEAFQEFVGESGGFVEVEAGFWIGRILNRVTLDLLEEPIDHAHVIMGVSY